MEADNLRWLVRAQACRELEAMAAVHLIDPDVTSRAREQLRRLSLETGFARVALRCPIPHPHRTDGTLAWFKRDCERWSDLLTREMILERLRPHIQDLVAIVLAYYQTSSEPVSPV